MTSSQTGVKDMKTESRLENILSTGAFAVTCECGPPKGANADVIRKKAKMIKGYVDAANVTDNQTSIVRLSSIASCAILKQECIEPIMQMVTRDRNRIAIQSDVFGAYALGINNMLCLTGDHQKFGNHPTSKNVFDMDSIQLIQTVRQMREDGRVLGGDEIDGQPKMFIGAASNPFADPFEFRVIRLAKKVKAGCDFVQTQCIYNLKKLKDFMQQVRDRGLDKKVYILGGVTPIKSLGMAKYMKEKVAGMDVPDEIIDRIKCVPKEKRADEGIKICVETIRELKEMEGIAGVHIMAIEWEEMLPVIVEEAGLLPRPGQ
jgi:methylenetetrahydrofolate reductase (NADPH)